MYKIIDCQQPEEQHGLFCEVVQPGVPMVKTASQLHPDIARFIANIKSSPDKVYILVNALGAGEYYGANFNGDYFEESELNPKDPNADYGYKTFLNAGVFRNHQNKDKAKSLGRVCVAVYNEAMHRVELVLEISKANCEEHGHEDLFNKLASGDKLAVSMGCKVLLDRCNICGNEAKTRENYCEHAREQLGQTLENGKKVCVYNPKPKFFDISIVVIGADRTSYVMAKLAHRRRVVVSSAQLAEDAGLRDTTESTKNLLKMALANKMANLVKEVPALAAKVMPTVDRHEEDLPDDLLDQLGGYDPSDALAAATAAGIVLKPREYQRVILVRIGHKPLADDLDRAGCRFPDTDAADDSLDFGNRSPDVSSIIQALLPFIAGRSAFEGPLTRRLSEPSAECPNCGQRQISTPLLLKISSAYNGYRQQLLTKMPEVVANITQRDVSLLSAINEPLLEESLLYGGLAKKAGVPSAPLALLGAVPLAYLYGAHVKSQQQSGESTGAVDSFVAAHPVLAASVFVGLARLGLHLQATGKLDELFAKVAD